jgi:hypothetical protein
MVGTANLDAGPAKLALSRQYGSEGWKPVLLDAIFLSADTSFDPNDALLWTPVYDTGELDSPDTEYVIESGLGPGEYRWRVQLLDGERLVSASGEVGVWSAWSEFRVR